LSTAQLLIVCLTILAAVGVVAGTVAFVTIRKPRRASDELPPPPRVGRRVTVHTKQPDDQTIFGVLAGDYSDRVSLEHAQLVTKDGTHALPGRQDIATRDVSWIDVHALVARLDVDQPAEVT